MGSGKTLDAVLNGLLRPIPAVCFVKKEKEGTIDKMTDEGSQLHGEMNGCAFYLALACTDDSPEQVLPVNLVVCPPHLHNQV
jgi:hypothetical protein